MDLWSDKSFIAFEIWTIDKWTGNIGRGIFEMRTTKTGQKSRIISSTEWAGILLEATPDKPERNSDNRLVGLPYITWNHSVVAALVTTFHCQ